MGIFPYKINNQRSITSKITSTKSTKASLTMTTITKDFQSTMLGKKTSTINSELLD